MAQRRCISAFTFDFNSFNLSAVIVNSYIIPLLSIPSFFSISIASALLPNITKAYTKKRYNEFNKKLGLELSTEQIDEIIHRDYTNGERWEHVLKTYVDEDGEEHSYWIVEDVAKKEQQKEDLYEEFSQNLDLTDADLPF